MQSLGQCCQMHLEVYHAGMSQQSMQCAVSDDCTPLSEFISSDQSSIGTCNCCFRSAFPAARELLELQLHKFFLSSTGRDVAHILECTIIVPHMSGNSLASGPPLLLCTTDILSKGSPALWEMACYTNLINS